MDKQQFREEEILFLIKRFEARTLPKAEWTHAAHLVVAVWYTSKYEEPEALALVRENIKKHNEWVGTQNTDTGGYHETITRFWLWVARQFLKTNSYPSIAEACNALVSAEFGMSGFPFEYYSKALLFSVYARHNWVEPDLKDLHQLVKSVHKA
jgi:hypothetical protein